MHVIFYELHDILVLGDANVNQNSHLVKILSTTHAKQKADQNVLPYSHLFNLLSVAHAVWKPIENVLLPAAW